MPNITLFLDEKQYIAFLNRSDEERKELRKSAVAFLSKKMGLKSE